MVHPTKHRVPESSRERQESLSEQCKEIKRTTDGERLEISGKLELQREHTDGHNKGQKWQT